MFPSAQFLHGEESGREIGKRPTLPPNVVEVDFFKAMELALTAQQVAERGTVWAQ